MNNLLVLTIMKPSILVGGQAVINGVMIRVPGTYATAVRDHIDIGLNWMRSDEDILNDRVQFWFTKLRHGKAQYSNHEESLVFDFTSSEEQTASDLSIKNPIYATLDTNVMTLSNYDNPDEGEFITI